MDLLGDVGHLESHFSLWRQCLCPCTTGARFCAKRTIGLGIILDAPDGIPRWRGIGEFVSLYLEMVLILMHVRCTVCVECTIGSDIVFDAPNGTPR
jgi:hypothetical protein